MVFADPADKGLTDTAATAAGSFLSSDTSHVHFACVACTAIVGRTPRSLEN